MRKVTFDSITLEARPVIKDRDTKIKQITTTIETGISQINDKYRSGPDLYFYKRLIDLRTGAKSVEDFLRKDYHIEILYATLVSWDMNSRGAKMKYFDDFKANIHACQHLYKKLGGWERSNNIELPDLLSCLVSTYRNISLMKTRARFVSNSKLLHFLFPRMLMPMDRSNTLCYFYGNHHESISRYLEIIELSFEIIRSPKRLENYLDDGWNTTIPKMVDNAIILQMGKSIK